MTTLSRALTLCAVPFVAALAQRADTAYAKVTYVSGSSVYIDAGQQDGLAEGASLDVLHRGRAVVALRARFLSPHRAQCDVVTAAEPPAVGDSVRYVRSTTVAAAPTPRDTAAAVQPGAPPPAPAFRMRSGSQRPLHGRIGARYMATWQADSGSGQLTQPATDIRVEGTIPGASSLEIAVDARARQTRMVAIDGALLATRTSTLVYQSSLAWRAGGARVRLGRQYSGDLSSVSLFDGALLEYGRPHVGIGAFGGTQPGATDMGFSSRVKEYGAYLALRAAPSPTMTASVTTGAISSYDGNQVDREFGFVTASWFSSVISVYASQELDYNRGWKQTLGMSTVTPTSTYFWIRGRATDAVTLSAGYDTRRNVRLYRNYVSPATAFDDAFRTGVWGGVSAQFGRVVNASLDARHSSGGAVDTTRAGRNDADVYTLTSSLRDALIVPIDFRERTSVYSSAMSSGWLQTLTMSGRPSPLVTIDLTGGVRHDLPAAGTASAAMASTLNVQWLELDTDIAIGRSWYLLLSVSRERGGWEGSDQMYTALTYRF